MIGIQAGDKRPPLFPTLNQSVWDETVLANSARHPANRIGPLQALFRVCDDVVLVLI